MKKRLISLILVLVLCLTACDISLSKPSDKPSDPPSAEASSYSDIKASDYVEIADNNYKGFNLNIYLDDVTDVHVEHEVAKLLSQNKPRTTYTNSNEDYVPTITAGDTVEIYYRGYILNEDGTKNYYPNMSNVLKFSDPSVSGSTYASISYIVNSSISFIDSPNIYYKGTTHTIIDNVDFFYNNNTSYTYLAYPSYVYPNLSPTKVTIGNGGFIPGFETSLIGKSVSEFPTLEIITSGNTTPDMLVNFNYNKRIVDESGCPFFVNYTEYVDLSQGEQIINEAYGFNIYEYLCNQEIGKNISIDENINLKISYAIPSHSYDGYEPIQVRFPNEYGITDLAGKEAWFEIYVQSITEYYDDSKGEGVFNDEFVTEVLMKKNSWLKDDLSYRYPDLSPSEQYRAYILDNLKSERENKYNRLEFETIINHYYSVANIKKYPKKIVSNLRQQYIDELNYHYKIYTGSRGEYDSSYKPENYSFDKYASTVLNVKLGETWEDKVTELARNEVKRKLILLYIIEREGIDISEGAMDKLIDDSIESNYSYFKNIYLSSTGKNINDYYNNNNLDALRNEVSLYMKENYMEELTIIVYQRLVYNKAISNFNINIITHT